MSDYEEMKEDDELSDELLSSHSSIRLKAVDANVMVKRPPKRYVVRHAVIEKGITILVGPSSVGKSFVLLSLAASMGSGLAMGTIRGAGFASTLPSSITRALQRRGGADRALVGRVCDPVGGSTGSGRSVRIRFSDRRPKD